LQYFNFVNLIGLGHSELARTVIGTSFEWIDLIAYTLGIVFVIYLEYKLSKKNSKQNFRSLKYKGCLQYKALPK